jgi:hypothetical protein
MISAGECSKLACCVLAFGVENAVQSFRFLTEALRHGGAVNRQRIASNGSRSQFEEKSTVESRQRMAERSFNFIDRRICKRSHVKNHG